MTWHILVHPQNRSHSLEDPQPKTLAEVSITHPISGGDLPHPRVPPIARILVYSYLVHFNTFLAQSGVGSRALALIRRLSPPGAGLPPYLCHRVAISLVAPILQYGADLFTPNVGSRTRLDTF